jgi:ubiquinone/menaquinone biosynthesis C-methylase UbiE
MDSGTEIIEAQMFRTKDREKCQQLFEKYYEGRKFHDSLYADLIRKHLEPGQRLLDAGCGRYLRFAKEFSAMAEVVGIDLDTTLETDNRNRPFAVRGDVGRLPFPDGYFDMVISRSVVEHLEDPPQVFREFFRVLRPGGKAVVITPNRFDYVSLVASVTPYRFHRALVSRIFKVQEDDVFPTLYRANTMPAIRKAFLAAGLRETELKTINHYPAYLMFSPVLFRLGVWYERLTSLEMFRALRGSILGVFEKPGLVAEGVNRHEKRQLSAMSR